MTSKIEQPRSDPARAASPDDTTPADATEVPAIHAAPDRPRGLNAWFAPGGEDEATEDRRADERRNLRLLLLMVVLLVGVPTLLTILALLQSLVTRGG